MISHAGKQGLAFDKQYVNRLTASPTPLHLGKVHRSWRGAYWFKGRHYRPIGELPGALESVHPSVWKRYEADASYRPRQLVKVYASA